MEINQRGSIFFPLGNNAAVCLKQVAKEIKSHGSVIPK